jgi:formate/nitrite transporter FocA (FNT family)
MSPNRPETYQFSNLTLGAIFFKNLLPVTMGNFIGGVVCVGLVYWFIYLRPRGKLEPVPVSDAMGI